MNIGLGQCGECYDSGGYIILVIFNAIDLSVYFVSSIHSGTKITLGNIYGKYLRKIRLASIGNSAFIDKSIPFLENLQHYIYKFMGLLV